ncbi:MAG: hypothetical protein R3C39_00010 [Dehalococcoidia bacterium]
MLNHVLSVGGTGMLARATSELASRARAITVVARRPERWEPPSDGSVTVDALAIDLLDADAVEAAVRDSIGRHGAIDEALIWTHPDTSAALTRLVALIAETSPSARVVQVFGSMAGRPGADREADRAALLEEAGATGLELHRVILGWQPDGAGGTRWLTHEEISSGVIAILDGTASLGVIGQLEPWEQRPGT